VKLPVDFLRTQSAAKVKPGHVLLVMSMVNWMAAFLTTGLNIALPKIQTDLNLGPVALGWVPLCYILAMAIVMVPFGKLADMKGRRLVFASGLWILFASTVALIFVRSYTPLVIFRALSGVGSGLCFASATAIVALAYPPKRRGFAMGIMAMTAYAGQASGPVLGGVIVDRLHWRFIFVVAAVYILINVFLDLWLLRRAEWKDTNEGSFDWQGSVVYAAALSALLLGLSWLPLTRGLVLTVVGIAGLAGFAWRESHARVPVFDLNLFRRNRLFALSNLTALISYASVWAMTYLMSLYLEDIKGLSPLVAGLVLVSGVVLQTVLSPFAGRLSDRVQPRWVVSTGMGFCVVGLAILSLLDFGTRYWVIFVGLCLLGIGYALFSGPNQAAIMGSVERKDVGPAGAMVGTMRVAGQALSVALVTLVLAVTVGRHSFSTPDYPHLVTGIHIAFMIMAALCALSILASLARGDITRHKAPAEAVAPVTEA
jgi:EmrB/QacA subfamily drug resistance transporter